MAARRSNGSNRVEPTFSGSSRGSASRGDLRLSADDRPGGGGSGGGRGPARGGGKRKPARKAQRPRRRRRSFIGSIFKLGLVLAFWGVVAVGGIIAWHAKDLPSTADLSIPQRPPSVTMTSSTGSVFATRGAMGESVRLEELPKYLPQAVMAIEDRRFYSHYGIDPVGLGRAAMANFTAGSVVQGGSTITQQLAKNLFLTPDRTMSRKIEELLLAFWLEAELSKDAILETYMNRVYLGGGAYGVEAAAQRYFGKSARHVTVAEAAILAGLLRAPSRFAPSRDKDAALARASVVLGQMVEAGYITQSQATEALAEPISVARSGREASSNYAADWVMDLLPGFVGEIEQDLVVETTIDLIVQDAAGHALTKALDEEGGDINASQGAAVAIDTNGAVKAVVGGRSYAASQFNRAVDAKRQPGSAFKPFVYLAALERGYRPNNLVEDAPVRIGNWSPENFDKRYRGTVSLSDALALSLNTVAARLSAEVGPSTVATTAHRLGISSPLASNASISLGTSETSLIELVSAYVPFASGGHGAIPHIITAIRTREGETLYERDMSQNLGQVVAPEHAAMMNQMLTETLTRGTGRRAQLPDWHAAGKTGTSQNFRDALFVGYTSHLVAGVWLGNDDGTPMQRATGGSLPASIWSDMMRQAHQGVPVAALPGADMVFYAEHQEPEPYWAGAQPQQVRQQQPHYPQQQQRGPGFFNSVEGFLDRLFGG